MHRPRPRFSLAIVLLAVLAACSSDGATAPQYQPQLVNLRNDFAFQVTALQGVTDELQYTWQHDGTVANVNQSPSNLSGAVTLVILDASGAQVYSRSLAENGTFVTAAGTPGMWTVRVRFTSASGAVNFRLQKP